MPVKILYIEDDLLVRENVAELLMLRGFDVSLASDGMEGIRLIDQVVPDLILCDISMPDIDGHQVLTSTRSIPALSHIPFIFLTAKADMIDLRKAMELGADDYLAKPFSISGLLAAIATRLKRVEQQGRIALSTNFLTTVKGRNERGYMLLKINECRCFNTQKRGYFVWHSRGLFHLSITLDKLMQGLDPQQFFRANRHFILHRSSILEYNYWEKGKYCIQINSTGNTQEVILPKARFKAFKNWLQG
ncbi:response regulator [Spirosoma pollinicola]|uniref:DNA-binding response regulator n=1 Tax=Spirosoma pollinicola TaxID=2057025 RepID=A0A2K8YTS7_9BACT|nr:response regulator [Spirosoma pollinicola]AUD01023.1 DNA-binding response regulator [Spirosoma pollinicola]